MQITNIPIDQLKPAKYNPRLDLQPDDKEYQDIKRSIVEFTLVEPLVINKDMTVIGGHQRLKVLKDLQYKEVPCIVVDLNKQKEKMLNIALNKISGDWDRPRLKDLLEELDSGEFDVNLTGFDEKEIETLMTQFHQDEYNTDFELPDGEKAPFQQMTFTLADEQAELIKQNMVIAKKDIVETFDNENSNGNALYRMVKEWGEQKI